MASEVFIGLGSDHENEDGILDNSTLAQSTSGPNEVGHQPSTLPIKEDILNTENMGRPECQGGKEDEEYLQTVDRDNDLIHQPPILEESVEFTEPVMVVKKMDVVKPGQRENGCTDATSVSVADSHMIDESSILGVKRARLTCVDQQPSVHVVYKFLTRASRKRLEDLLQQWSEWHARSESPSNNSSTKVLEHGEETYFPALHIGPEKSSTVSFWMDNQVRKGEMDYNPLDNDSVPLYDRGYALGSSDGSANPERIETLEASRCFNCGSYSHSLKECSKPRDNIAINLARKQHGSKRNPTTGSRVQTRYYQNSSGKYDDLRAGVLGPELRNCLGIGELDPPPWLHRMRELGYPPGYLDVEEDEDQPSGITIFADEDTKVDYEEGELSEKGEPVLLEKKMTVEFPGINAPIPENVDHRCWASSPGYPSSSDSFKSRSQYRSNHLSEPRRGNYHDQRWSRDFRDDGLPSPDYGVVLSHSPRYSPYDHNPLPRSPRRALSERGWRDPLGHEGSPGYDPQTPAPYSVVARHPHQHHSPSASLAHWAHESQYSVSPDVSSQRRDRQDHRHQHRR